MKIIRQCYPENDSRKVANLGCDKCPNCGEDKKDIEYIRTGVTSKGVSHYLFSEMHSYGFLHIKSKQFNYDEYECKTCGCKWKSDEWVEGE